MELVALTYVSIFPKYFFTASLFYTYILILLKENM